MTYSETHAMELEGDYPYTARDGTCTAVASKGKVNTQTINNVVAKDASQLMAAIAKGPTAVTVDASSSVFQGYKSGVVNSSACGTTLNHAITGIGYGNDGTNDYYIVRNSWGAGWGDQGYINIATENKYFFNYGICGIQQTSLWPTTN